MDNVVEEAVNADNDLTIVEKVAEDNEDDSTPTAKPGNDLCLLVTLSLYL